MKYIYIRSIDCLGATVAQWDHAGLRVSVEQSCTWGMIHTKLSSWLSPAQYSLTVPYSAASWLKT